MMDRLNKSYDAFMPKVKLVVDDVASKMNLNPDKAANFADKILHAVAEMQTDNVKHAKKLLDHLVKSGNKSQKLQTHLDKEMLADIAEEQKYIEEDMADKVFKDVEAWVQQVGEYANTSKTDALKDIIQGFWAAFDEYERAFGGKVRQNMNSFKEGLLHDQIEHLYFKMKGPNAISEDEIREELGKIDLMSVGAPLGTHPDDMFMSEIVEELFIVPQIPHEELEELKLQWKSGKKDSVTVFSRLQQMYAKKMLPSWWL